MRRMVRNVSISYYNYKFKQSMLAVISSTVAENGCMMHVHYNASQHALYTSYSYVVEATSRSIMYHSQNVMSFSACWSMH